jgi:hypothetical protein
MIHITALNTETLNNLFRDQGCSFRSPTIDRLFWRNPDPDKDLLLFSSPISTPQKFQTGFN